MSRFGRFLVLACLALAACAAESVPLPTPNHETATGCEVPWRETDIAMLRSHGVRVAEIEDVPAFLVGFNAIPPVSNSTADRVVVLQPPTNHEIYLLVFIKGECIEATGQLDHQQFEAVMGRES